MDVFTHLMIGAAATSPFWATHPLESVVFTFGSIIPDVDAVSRQFGKVAYLDSHQGWTHSVWVHGLLTLVGSLAVVAADHEILLPSVAAFGLGAVVHSLLDWTNTWGVRLFAPVDGERRALEWVFFIDATVIALTASTLIVQATHFERVGTTLPAVALAWLVAVVGYFALKAGLRRRAGKLAPHARALIPSALVPWWFYGLDEPNADGIVTSYRLDARDGARNGVVRHQTFDDEWAGRLGTLREYAAMRKLSVGYHVVEVSDSTVTCRDLRTRNNFGTEFGRLVVTTGDDLSVERFDV